MTTRRWRTTSTVAYVDRGDDGVALLPLWDPATARPFKTFGAGAVLWRLLASGSRTIQECCDHLGVSEAEISQVELFLGTMVEAHLLEVRDD